MSPELQLRRKLAAREIEPRFIKMDEAAKRIGVTKPTLKLWRLRGIGPLPWKPGSRTIRYTEQEVDMFLHRVAVGDQRVARSEQSWDPKTLRLLEESKTPQGANDTREDQKPDDPPSETGSEEEARLRAFGLITD